MNREFLKEFFIFTVTASAMLTGILIYLFTTLFILSSRS